MKENKTIVIVGPTAAGKTEFAVRLARKLGAEIISADSRQVYKYMAVGTCQPDKRQLSAVKHHLVNFLEPDKTFNAGEFAREARKIIKKTNKHVIVVGGTGLYIKALIDGLSPIPETDPEIKRRLQKEMNEKGCEHMHKKLLKIDPETADKTDPRHSSRILRALEVYHSTGKPISHWHAIDPEEKVDANIFGLKWERADIIERIKNRTEIMLKQGMIEET